MRVGERDPGAEVGGLRLSPESPSASTNSSPPSSAGSNFASFQAERQGSAALPAAKAGDIEARLIGTSTAVKKLIQQIKKLAGVRTPVLLQGERGTGKATVTEVLHPAATPPNRRWKRIDCSLSSDANFHAGLLGENGGRRVGSPGQGRHAVPRTHPVPLPPMQKELVSVLRNTAHGFRLICTTSEDLEKLTDEGRFHDELFYRVLRLPVHLPPLRDRTDDIRRS